MTHPSEAATATGPIPALTAIPEDMVTLADYERRAAAHVERASWKHIQSGTGAEITLAENLSAFDRLMLVPRVLRDLRQAASEVSLLGERHTVPFVLAPIAYQKLAHPDGELAMVRGAVGMNVGVTVSTLSSVSLEEIADSARAMAAELERDVPPLWFQLYFQADREFTLQLVKRAEQAGYSALVVTADASIKLSNFPLPAGVEAVNLRGMPRQSHASSPADANILFGTPLADLAPRWEDLAWLRERTRLPIILKGILSADDAECACQLGLEAIVVSNHGGRVLDGLPSPLAVLPAISERVAGRTKILCDSGIRRGTDIVKAIASGADAVLLGRPYVHAMAVAGTLGVAHALYLLRVELELAMAQVGCATVSEIDRSRLLPAAMP